MKILIPEKFSQAGIDVLEAAGYTVDFKPQTTPEELVEIIGGYDGLIVRSATTVTREVIEAGENLKVIGRAGVGVDNIDRDAALLVNSLRLLFLDQLLEKLYLQQPFISY